MLTSLLYIPDLYNILPGHIVTTFIEIKTVEGEVVTFGPSIIPTAQQKPTRTSMTGYYECNFPCCQLSWSVTNSCLTSLGVLKDLFEIQNALRVINRVRNTIFAEEITESFESCCWNITKCSPGMA